MRPSVILLPVRRVEPAHFMAFLLDRVFVEMLDAAVDSDAFFSESHLKKLKGSIAGGGPRLENL